MPMASRFLTPSPVSVLVSLFEYCSVFLATRPSYNFGCLSLNARLLLIPISFMARQMEAFKASLEVISKVVFCSSADSLMC